MEPGRDLPKATQQGLKSQGRAEIFQSKVFILPKVKIRHREGQCFAQSHTANQRQSKGENHGPCVPTARHSWPSGPLQPPEASQRLRDPCGNQTKMEKEAAGPGGAGQGTGSRV